jgi:dTDP-4-amino-4,6-dideoxygalactose transaminase/acetyltransferase-like isoleucine patch superfamily enzyme
MADGPVNDAPYRSIDGVTFGENVVVHSFTNLYGCEIGDNTRIGPFVEIQRGARIGEDCKVQSHAFICSGVEIQNEVFVGHGVVFVNDKFPRVSGDWEELSTVVEHAASLGSGAVVLGGVRIGRGALVGAGAVVSRDVEPGQVVVGNPARPLPRREPRGADSTRGTAESRAATVPLVDLRRQYRSIKEEIDAALLEVVASGTYILGEEVRRFEEEFASYCGTEHCVGVSSGTAAIGLALEAVGVGEGDEVIVPANTFIASALPVLRLGAKPVLVDCDEATATLDPGLVANAIGPDTKAIVAVHLYGQPTDVDPLLELCAKHGLALVEDACQAHGARYKGRRVGGLGHMAVFSFYPSKNLGAYGDGGAITTDDQEVAERIRVRRDLGRSNAHTHAVEGWNDRLDAIQAAVLRVKLRHLDRWNDLRRLHAATYDSALAGTRVRTPDVAAWAEHVWHLYVVRVAERDEVRSLLAAEGIETGLHYPLPLHLQPALAHLGYERGDFPVTEAWAGELLSLPMFPELEPSEIERVAEAVATLDLSRAE